jgi:outer membrane protein assembly factor BamB
MRHFSRSHMFRRCCSFLVLPLLLSAITLGMSMQHHATQAAGSHLAANSQSYTVKGNTQAERNPGGTAYVGSNDHIVYALNASNGLIRWGGQTGNAVESSPAVANGFVYVGSFDNNMYAFFAKTGVLRWRFLTGSFVFSSPAVGSSQGL